METPPTRVKPDRRSRSRHASAATPASPLGTDPRYAISSVDISNNIDGQLSWAPGNAPTTAVITDQDTQSGEGYYRVVVSDSVANCTFPCDPRIKNV
ncbi:hypothetical protein [Luteimonas kalidii]|uniref:Uncharacterized protein n=1 Tax=Luteimonas kalidii TaxID=3042025 RepID=A0ABT6JRG2_9GAMM|nr:hypothetical protein [Luteimonas kalidii]MDH5833275.1 hypothetical protein [Luteimonas kalidii]